MKDKSALLNTCLATIRFREGASILYFNLWPKTFIQYDMTSGKWIEQDGGTILPIEITTEDNEQSDEAKHSVVLFLKVNIVGNHADLSSCPKELV